MQYFSLLCAVSAMVFFSSCSNNSLNDKELNIDSKGAVIKPPVSDDKDETDNVEIEDPLVKNPPLIFPPDTSPGSGGTQGQGGGGHGGTANENGDDCPLDPEKNQPGTCGCGVPDSDLDDDGLADCRDNCPADANLNQGDRDNDGQGDLCDCAPDDPSVGAFSGLTRYVDPSGSDVANDCLNFNAPCQTITYAIAQASPQDGISLAAGTFNESALVVDKNLVIFGVSANATIVNGQLQNRVFSINPLIEATFCNFRIRQGLSLGEGGGIFSEGDLTLVNAAVSNNTSANGGGLRTATNTTTIISNTLFEGNVGTSFGGGISNGGSLLITNDSIVRNNTAVIAAGGVGTLGLLTISDNVLFTGNTTSGSGGAISSAGTVVISDSSFIANSAQSSGAIASGGSLTITNVTVSGNNAVDFGGGIGSADNLLIYDSFIIDNAVTGSGGGINSDGNMTILNTTISGNTAGENGGGIREADVTEISPSVLIENSTLSNNSAGFDGGGIAIYSQNLETTTVTLKNSTFSANSVTLNGGGIHAADNSVIIMNNSTIASNTATGSGGGIYKESLASATSFHSLMVNNTAQNCATNVGNVLTTSNYSLFSDNSCTFTAGANNVANLAPLIGPLQNNGGPTKTHALLSLSPAIDRGDTSCNVNTDQRGEPRPVNIVGVSPIDAQTRCDIGAFELQP